jgi:hypothetical protein
VATNFLTVMSGRPAAWQPMHAVAVLLVFGPVAAVVAWMARTYRPAPVDMDTQPLVRVP